MKKINVKTVLRALDVIETNIAEEYYINTLIQLNSENENEGALFWCNDKNISSLEKVKTGTVIVSKLVKSKSLHPGLKYIVVENPRRSFSKILNEFFSLEPRKAGISPSAKISSLVKLGSNVTIGDNVVIEDNCEVGDNTIVLHNTVIHSHTIIGNNVLIGCNNTIGGIGFGYEVSEEGTYELIPHIGNVIIKNNVEIGNNTCIDRAVLGSTVIGENVKIDNLVHIAHGVEIGSNSLIIAHTMIGGSSVIGSNVWVSPGALIINKCSVGDNSLVGMGAVVIKPVLPKTIVAGNPAKFLKEK